MSGSNTMIKADARRMFTSSPFYILCGVALAVPVLILVMTSMVGGDGGMAFTNTWQIIGSEMGGNAMAAMMDMTAMMNINLVYFLAGVFTCAFVAEDFKSGYVKNLFTVRAKKGSYVASKTLVCFLASAIFLLSFFVGAVLGGAIAGLPFTLGAAGIPGLVMCMLAKIFLMSVFVAIAVLVSAFAKQRSWLSILLFLFGGMLLFMMIPMLTPLNAGVMNVGMCLAGGAIFAVALGCVSNFILQKQDLV